MAWLRVYAPLDRLDAGLLTLLGIWVLTLVAGLVVWWADRRRRAGPGS